MPINDNKNVTIYYNEMQALERKIRDAETKISEYELSNSNLDSIVMRLEEVNESLGIAWNCISRGFVCGGKVFAEDEINICKEDIINLLDEQIPNLRTKNNNNIEIEKTNIKLYKKQYESARNSYITMRDSLIE